MLLEGLPSEDLGEKVSWVHLARNVTNNDAAGAAKLTHLEELAVNVTRVLCRCKAVAQIICSLAVGADLDGVGRLVAQRTDYLDDMEQFDRRVAQGHQLGFAR